MLKQTLILSGVLNVIFLGIFFYFFIRENPFPIAFEYAPLNPPVEKLILPVEVIGELAPLSSQELQAKLNDDTHVRDGYRIKDFALAILGFRDHLDVRRALGKKNLSERRWKIGSKHELTLYPELEADDFVVIQAFLKEEKWPETSYGLYLQIKKQGTSADPALLQMFCQTPEFLAVEVLFGPTCLPIKKGTLLALLIETPWPLIDAFLQKQRAGCDLSEHARRQFLIQSLMAHSQTAAYLLLMTDFTFAVDQLENSQVIVLLDLISKKTTEAVRYLKEIINSLRPEEIRQQAVDRLKSLGVESKGEIAARPGPRPSIGELRPVFRDKPPASPPPGIHVIQAGESLWLIARKYQVSIEELKATNHLSSPTIQPGKTLKIPRH